MSKTLLRKLLAVVRTIFLFVGGISLCMGMYLIVIMVIGQTSLSKDHPDLSTFESLPYRVLAFAVGALILAWLIAKPKLEDSEFVPTFAQDSYTNEEGEEVFIVSSEQSYYRYGGYFNEEGVQIIQLFFTIGLVGLSMSLMISAFTKIEAGLVGLFCFVWQVVIGYSLAKFVSFRINIRRSESKPENDE